jgi:RNA polymerase sigma factor (sigma-70 family)
VGEQTDPDASATPAHSGSQEFDAAASRVFAALQERGQLSLSSQDMEQVVDTLRGYMRRYGLSEDEADDASQEVALKLMSLGDALHDIDNPAAYLTRLARNHAIDELRRQGRRSSANVELSPRLANQIPAGDDAIAALLAESATAQVIRHAMRGAIDAQDHLVLRIVSTWLDIADEIGDAPASRLVAERVGVSHTSVNQALKRFRRYFPSASVAGEVLSS